MMARNQRNQVRLFPDPAHEVAVEKEVPVMLQVFQVAFEVLLIVGQKVRLPCVNPRFAI
jgi:hypothetical protein